MKLFIFPLSVSALIVIGALILEGPAFAFLLVTLAVLEVSLSFDNAVINALWLKRMSPFWQRMFLTVGILVAVFGMRLVFPVIVVALAAHLSITQTINLALHDSDRYAHTLEAVHHEIAVFGAVFLGMIFLEWLFEERDVHWLGPIERFFAKAGKVDYMAPGVMLVLVLVLARGEMVAGVASMVTYLGVSAFSSMFESEPDDGPEYVVRHNGGLALAKPVAMGGMGAFLYLELMDASFSFDGVMAAFAVSNDVVLIAIGLGIGALFVRTLTVYLVNQGVLDQLVHLEHGAHWAIGVLAGLMFASLFVNVHEVITAGLSLVCIGAALVTSIHHNRTQKGLI